jgi:hypothetical protein
MAAKYTHDHLTKCLSVNICRPLGFFSQDSGREFARGVSRQGTLALRPQTVTQSTKIDQNDSEVVEQGQRLRPHEGLLCRLECRHFHTQA